MKVSIVTPSYNQGQFIESTIQSVLNQTYKDIEYILIDGGSIDNTIEIVNRYKDKIDIIISEKDRGQSDAINKGFRLATGDLVGWINSDDILFPNCVEEIVKLADCRPDGCIYYPAAIELIDQNGRCTGEIKKIINNKDVLVNKDYSVVQQGSFYRLDFVRKANFLDADIHYCMDLDLWLRLLDYGEIYFYDGAPLAAFRIWGDSKTNTGGMNFLIDIKRTLKKHRMSFFSSNNTRLNWYMVKALIKQSLLTANL